MRVVERTTGKCGELVLRQDGTHYEIIANGMFLMDTRHTASEVALVSMTLEACQPPAKRLLLAGLGVGASLSAARGHAQLLDIDVVELERPIIDWHQRVFSALYDSGGRDYRVIEADVWDHLHSAPSGYYDAIAIDTDNGPDWLLRDVNSRLYSQNGLHRLRDRLTVGGALGVWATRRVPEFEAALTSVFGGDVEHSSVARPGTPPDVIYVVRNQAACTSTST